MTHWNSMIRASLQAGVAASAILMFSQAASANDEVAPTQPAAQQATPVASAGQDVPISEEQRYALRTMMQIYDGTQDVSQSQLVGVGRVRSGNRSYTELDFGDGAVVVQGDGGGLAAGRFLNNTQPETAVIYNYDDKTIFGDDGIAIFHNGVIRPLLDKAPPLGTDTSWSTQLSLAQTGVSDVTGGDLKIELSREYFTHDGLPMVLVHYAIPVFSYSGERGQMIVQWGRGFSLTDPGFGIIYINSALHRAVVSEPGLAARPYRYARTMVAADADGSATVDYRDVPQLAPYIDEFFSKDAMQVVPPLETAATHSAGPLALAINLDRIAMSIAENGANENGSITAAQQNGDPTTTTDALKTVDKVANRINQVGQMITVTKTGASLLSMPQFLNKVLSFQTQAEMIDSKLSVLATEMKQAEALLKSAPLVPEYSPRLVQLQRQQEALTRRIDLLELTIDGTRRQIAELEAAGEVVPQVMRDELADAYRLRTDSFQRMRGVTTAMEEASELENAVKMVPDLSNPNAVKAMEMIEDLNAARKTIEGESRTLGTLGVEIMQHMAVGSDYIKRGLEAFSNSPAGKFFDALGHVMNVVTVGKVGYNSYDAATRNIGAGDLPLTRSYGNSLDALGTLGLDLVAMGANALSGNVPGFWSDFTAITAGTFTDTLIAAKGVRDVERLNVEALQEGVRLQKELTARVERNMRQFDAKWGDKPVLPNYAEGDPYADGYGLPPWPEGEDPADQPQPTQDPADGSGPTNPAPKPPAKPPVFAEPDPYPKADPIEPSERVEREPEPSLEEQGFVAETEQERWLRETREENAEAAKRLSDYQDDLLANRDDTTIFDGDYDMRVSTLETSDLLVSLFDIDPVEFEPPEWEPPTWEPPEWVPPEFDPPDISKIPPTDPDDVDGYPGTGEYPAFDFDGLSGTVETDLSRWEDWLATQNVAYLTKLALAAGYPNLASALADAENIIRQSQDSGYRKWANEAPSCGGIVGCGPQYLERWAMKRSIVALGDILVQSREVFSTGGFSDIGISGFNLAYMLRDFGIQDGDLIDVEIQQFGRTIGKLEGHFLTTAGDNFNVNLRPGVASMVVTALNEGSASPNTAEVTIENVVRGEGRQTYNLNTGQTATLRIEANATPN